MLLRCETAIVYIYIVSHKHWNAYLLLTCWNWLRQRICTNDGVFMHSAYSIHISDVMFHMPKPSNCIHFWEIKKKTSFWMQLELRSICSNEFLKHNETFQRTIWMLLSRKEEQEVMIITTPCLQGIHKFCTHLEKFNFFVIRKCAWKVCEKWRNEKQNPWFNVRQNFESNYLWV